MRAWRAPTFAMKKDTGGFNPALFPSGSLIFAFLVPTESLVYSSRAEYVYDLPGSKDEIVPKEEKKEAGCCVWVLKGSM